MELEKNEINQAHKDKYRICLDVNVSCYIINKKAILHITTGFTNRIRDYWRRKMPLGRENTMDSYGYS